MPPLFLTSPDALGLLLVTVGTVSLVFSHPLAALDRHLERFVAGGIAETASRRWVETSGAVAAVLGLVVLLGGRLL